MSSAQQLQLRVDERRRPTAHGLAHVEVVEQHIVLLLRQVGIHLIDHLRLAHTGRVVDGISVCVRDSPNRGDAAGVQVHVIADGEGVVVGSVPRLDDPALRDLVVAEGRLLGDLVGVLVHVRHSLDLLLIIHGAIGRTSCQAVHQPECGLAPRLRVGQILCAGQIDALAVHVEILVRTGDEYAFLPGGLVQPQQLLLHVCLLDGRGIAGTEQLRQHVLRGRVRVLLRPAPSVNVGDLRAGDVVQPGNLAGELAGQLLPEVRDVLVLVHVGGHPLVVDGAVTCPASVGTNCVR